MVPKRDQIGRAAPGVLGIEPPASGRALIDGHVHVHPMFGIDAFLAAAAANLGGAAPGWLLLADMPGEGAFERLSAHHDGGRGWTIEAAADPAALYARSGAALRLVLIAGRQLTTREGLEVLAVGTRAALPDGLWLGETVARVREVGAVPVLPWAFGKWWGRRGRALVRLLERPPAFFCLGDNAGRLEFGPEPRLFQLARAAGVPILPGSDPLPRPSEIRKVGRYGFVLADLDLERPAVSLEQRLSGLRHQPPVFGHRDGLWRFSTNQLMMQFRRRMPA